MFANDPLAQTDPQLFAAIDQENTRQEQHIELIASENYASPQVLAAQGSQLTNKYAEGYPRKRYYGGCDYVDQVELLAIERARALFGAEYVNVQPHSGSSANAAVCMALLEPHDTILGMALDQGGHLTHGAKVNFSGKTYSAKSYGLQADGYLDYQQLEQVALEVKPKLIIAGFSAYSRIVDWQAFRRVADMVGAYLLADMAHVAGLVATGHYPSPIAHADIVTTTTHKSLRSARGGMILSRDPELGKKINSSVFPGNQGGPLMHAIAGKAVGFGEALRPEFSTYQQQVVDNANALANKLIENGLAIVSGGTDNHLMLVDLVDKGITGKDLDLALGRCHITVNKNAVPNDPQSPFVTSGIRLGTPAITTRGFGTSECQQIADWITRIANNLGNDSVEQQVCGEVAELCTQFPVYPHS